MFDLKRSLFRTVDTIDYLSKRYDIVDCSIPGYRLVDEAYYKLYRVALNHVIKQPSGGQIVFLFSLGGNDYIDHFERFVQGSGLGAKLNRRKLKEFIHHFVWPKLYNYMSLILSDVNGFNTKPEAPVGQVRFIFHGYDYFHPEKEPASDYQDMMRQMFIARHIPFNIADRIVRDFIDTIDHETSTLLETVPAADFIDLRGMIPKDYWAEQIHPTSEGYRIIAQKFMEKLRELGIPEKYENTHLYRRAHYPD